MPNLDSATVATAAAPGLYEISAQNSSSTASLVNRLHCILDRLRSSVPTEGPAPQAEASRSLQDLVKDVHTDLALAHTALVEIESLLDMDIR